MSDQIKINKLSESKFLVTVSAEHITTHEVTLDEDSLKIQKIFLKNKLFINHFSFYSQKNLIPLF